MYHFYNFQIMFRLKLFHSTNLLIWILLLSLLAIYSVHAVDVNLEISETIDIDGNYTLRWNGITEPIEYLLQESQNESFTDPTNIYEGGATSFDVKKYEDGVYYYRVKVLNQDEWSNTVTVKVSLLTPLYPLVYVHGHQGSPDSQNILISKIKGIRTIYTVYAGDTDDFLNQKGPNSFPLNSIWKFGYYKERWSDTNDYGDEDFSASYRGKIGGIPIATGDYDYDNERVSYAEQLKRAVDNILLLTGAPKVNMIAVSMGGLVARAYITWLSGYQKVNKLLTIVTPNHGVEDIDAWLASLAAPPWMGDKSDPFSDSWTTKGELTEMDKSENANFWDGNTYIYWLDHDWDLIRNYLQYATIAGNYNPNPLGLGPDDGVVNVDSVHLDGAVFNSVYFGAHSTETLSGNIPEELTVPESTYCAETIKRWIFQNQIEKGGNFLYFLPAPNPFDRQLSIKYELLDSDAVAAQIFLYDYLGELVGIWGAPLYEGPRAMSIRSDLYNLANEMYIMLIKAYNMDGGMLNEQINVAHLKDLEGPASVPTLSFTSTPNYVVVQNNAYFEFVADVPDTQFQYRLDGGEWSDYSENNQVSFSNLEPGMHTFYVAAKIAGSIREDVGTWTWGIVPSLVRKGVVVESEEWKTAVFIEENVVVPVGVTLSLAPGTQIYFNENAQLIVNGTLKAQGTPEKPIRFTSLSMNPGYWKGIQFNAMDSTSELILQHAIIEYAQNGIEYAANANNSSLEISNCEFRQLTGDGIVVTVLGKEDASRQLDMVIRNNQIHDTEGFGMRLMQEGGSVSGWILRNVISHTEQSGLWLQLRGVEASQLHISGNYIYDVYRAVWLQTGGDISPQVRIVGNEFVDNISALHIERHPEESLANLDILIAYNWFREPTAPQQSLWLGGISRPGVCFYYNRLDTDNSHKVVNNTSEAVDARFNWWGTNDIAKIQSRIDDIYDDSNKGVVDISHSFDAPLGEGVYANIPIGTNAVLASHIIKPIPGSAFRAETYRIVGIASATAGLSKVELSTDGGITWQAAEGDELWHYDWQVPGDGEYRIQTRAVASDGSVQSPVTASIVTIDNTLPTVSGMLQENEIWQGIVNITGDLFVPAGITLTIQAGTQIQFPGVLDDTFSGADSSRCEFRVEGGLRVEGTSEKPVVFTSSGLESLKPYWLGIQIIHSDESDGDLSFQHALIEHAQTGIHYTATAEESSPVIIGCEIRNISVDGINLDFPDVQGKMRQIDFMIQDNKIYEVSGFGIHIYQSNPRSSGQILGNEVHNNGSDGIRVEQLKVQDSDIHISNNRVYQNAGHGICLLESNEIPPQIGISGNDIHNNALDGIHIGVIPGGLEGNIELSINHNEIHDNGGQGIWLDEFIQSSVHINYNNLYSNGNYEVYNSTTQALDARFNWWGDASTLRIFDIYDDANVAVVDYSHQFATPLGEGENADIPVGTDVILTSRITKPVSGSRFKAKTYRIMGIATSSIGLSRVEISTDSGATWQEATGKELWSYDWNILNEGEYRIQARAVAADGTEQSPPAGITVTIDNTLPITSGVLQENEVWQDTVDITGDVTVPVGFTLTVRPGTQIQFTPLLDDTYSGSDSSRCELFVPGTLKLEGSITEPIVFSSARETPAKGDWGGIRLLHTNTGGELTIAHVVIEYAQQGVHYISQTETSAPLIQDNEIRYCAGDGIRLKAESSARLDLTGFISRINIHHNDGNGIYISLGSTTIDGNERSFLLEENTISDNTLDGIRLELLGSNRINIQAQQNQITKNQGYGIHVLQENGTYCTLSFTDNLIRENSLAGVYVERKSELFSPAPIELAMTYNEVTGNLGGGIVLNYLRSGSKVTIRYNNLYGNTAYDLYNATPILIDARLNWWGDETTVILNAGGTPTAIQGKVDYADWFLEVYTRPPAPTVDPVQTPTNNPVQVLSGTRLSQKYTIWINGSANGVTYPTATRWTYTITLTEGENHILVTQRDEFGGESMAVAVTIILDLAAPSPVTNFTTRIKDNAVQLSWQNPDDADFAGVTIFRKQATPRAMYVWNIDSIVDNIVNDVGTARHDLFEFCRAPHGYIDKPITTLYFEAANHIRDNAVNLSAFIKDAHNHGISVYYLDGEPDWATTHFGVAQSRLNDVIAFNAAGEPDERFDGIQFDVEPHELDDFWTPEIWEFYLELLRYSQEVVDNSGQDLVFGCAIPFWYDQGNPEQNFPPNSHTAVQDIVDYVVIMDYRDSAEDTGHGGGIELAQTEIDYAQTIGKSVVLAFETQPIEPEYITFTEEGYLGMERELDAVNAYFASADSFDMEALHHYLTYRDLFAGDITDFNDNVGMKIYNGIGTSYTDADVEMGQMYYYIAYTYDSVPNYSPGVRVSAQNILYGDVSGNGEVTPYDASLVLRHVVGIAIIPKNSDQWYAADVTGDGTISALDAAYILQYTVGLITVFPVSPKTGIRLAYRTTPQHIEWGEISVSNDNDIVIPIQIKDARNVLSAEFTVDYDDTALKFKQIHRGVTNSWLEACARIGQIKLALANATPINGNVTLAFLTFERLTDASIPNALGLTEAHTNEGMIPTIIHAPLLQITSSNMNNVHKTPDNIACSPEANQKAIKTLPTVIPTPHVVFFYSLNSTFQGEPVKKGDIITAEDPDGVICGVYIVETEGRYGYMPVYGDDLYTEADEGAIDGDEITFYINGQCAHPSGDEKKRKIPFGTSDVIRREIDLQTGACLHLSGEVLINSQPAPIGTIITAQTADGGEITRYVVRKAGRYGVMHIRETNKFQKGDVITLAVDGQTVETNGESIVWDGESKSVQRDLAAVHLE